MKFKRGFNLLEFGEDALIGIDASRHPEAGEVSYSVRNFIAHFGSHENSYANECFPLLFIINNNSTHKIHAPEIPVLNENCLLIYLANKQLGKKANFFKRLSLKLKFKEEKRSFLKDIQEVELKSKVEFDLSDADHGRRRIFYVQNNVTNEREVKIIDIKFS